MDYVVTSTQALNIQNSEECSRRSVGDGEKMTAKFSSFPENYSKSTKIASTTCKFLKFFLGSMPRTPRAFFVSHSA